MHRNDPAQAFRHGAYERLRFIEDRLFWEARINRSDLIEAFGISPAQAAIDFREYMKLAGEAISYDTRAKAYTASSSFVPVLETVDARARLDELAQSGDPFTAKLPHLNRPLPADAAARLRHAAQKGRKVLIDYQSMTRPDAHERWIAPSRLVSDGERWHTRAWCYERREWRDFVLARILALKADEPAGEVPSDDEWNTQIAIILKPASWLSDAQKAAVACEYAMSDGSLRIVIPKALRLYAMRRWGLHQKDSRLELAEECVVDACS
ncbi:hypothetical protein Rvan_1898 [Rhodomicrobium vannielii ATCC 17100]|uniref:Uncharacterized protein n=1 Tax=Rhodomicrobium vannielii (strain ATCC 17100 / DSM 162 / LMG 4299 / NCIMB 10020 / ATH 3.1.1) TaxID=648757 RepID=E3I0P4_RHOVT|nr:WYL domain-containing protein [Rhodomicrobium vannielii]ADP71134.1 hypothetical protein Rvan_1898 [Rhodomicrobium vannielii ATCC 17100]